jgi:hypothetical protein
MGGSEAGDNLQIKHMYVIAMSIRFFYLNINVYSHAGAKHQHEDKKKPVLAEGVGRYSNADHPGKSKI